LSPREFAQNAMKIIDNQPAGGVKKKFVVCTKPLVLTTTTNPMKFVEWVETLKILGAEQIFMYHRYFDPEVFKVAKYYEKQGFMVLEQHLEPSGVSRAKTHCYESRINEMPILNDCFYRVRNLFEHVVVIDHDEVLIPTRENETTWHDLIEGLKGAQSDSYALRSVTYPPTDAKIEGAPEYSYMLHHVQVFSRSPFSNFHSTNDFQRAVKFKNTPAPVYNCKSIMKPDNISVIFGHGAEYCWNRACKINYVNESIGQCSHYRESFKEPSDNVTQIDMTFWKYKDVLVKAVERTLKELKSSEDMTK
jgi:hypothetical protein